jgi:hypothetical protein
MPKFNKLEKLLASIYALLVVWLGLAYVIRAGAARMLIGAFLADKLYPIAYYTIEIIGYIVLLGIPAAIIWLIIRFIRNRHKPEEPSEEARAITEGMVNIENAIRDEFKKVREALNNGDKPKSM